MREATIHVPDAALADVGLEGLVALFREAGLRDLSEVVCGPAGCVLVASLDARPDEEALDRLDAVDGWTRVRDGEAVVYLCRLATGGTTDAVDACADRVGGTDLRVDEEGVTLSVVGPQEAIASHVAAYDDAGATVALRRLADYDGPTGPLDALTDRQRETLETAFRLGYFDVPRDASTADVAAELDGLDPSTVAEHLQRAERNLLSALLG